MSRPRRYMERRFAAWDPGSVEVREKPGGGGLQFRGHAAVFDQEADFGFMREVIRPGAFTKTLKDGADVRYLYNHNPDSVMARTTQGTLRLSEDDSGLAVEADLPEDDWDAQRLAPKLRAGNVSQMSFGFSVVRDKVSKGDEDETELRELLEMELFDVSSVTFPAYDGAEGGLRDLFGFLGVPLPSMPAKEPTLDEIFERIEKLDGEADPETIRSAIAMLTAQLPPESEPLIDEHLEPTVLPLERMRLIQLNRNRIAVA